MEQHSGTVGIREMEYQVILHILLATANLLMIHIVQQAWVILILIPQATANLLLGITRIIIIILLTLNLVIAILATPQAQTITSLLSLQVILIQHIPQTLANIKATTTSNHKAMQATVILILKQRIHIHMVHMNGMIGIEEMQHHISI